MQQTPSRPMYFETPTLEEEPLISAVDAYERRLASHPIDAFGISWDGESIDFRVDPPKLDGEELGYRPPPFVPLNVAFNRLHTPALEFQPLTAAFNQYCTVVVAQVRAPANLDLFSDWILRGIPERCGICISDAHGGYYYVTQARGLEEASDGVDAVLAFEPFLYPVDLAMLQVAEWSDVYSERLEAPLTRPDFAERIRIETERCGLGEMVRNRAATSGRSDAGRDDGSLLDWIRSWLHRDEH